MHFSFESKFYAAFQYTERQYCYVEEGGKNGGAGMRLIKLLLLLSGAAFFLPAPPEDPAAQGQANAEISTLAMITSASLAYADVASFCQRQPGVCQTAGYAAARLEAKAKYSMKLAYEWANGATAEPDTSATITTVKADKAGKADQPSSLNAVKADLLTTQSTTVAAAEAPKESQSTLKLEDLIPEWRGPAQGKKKQS